MLENTYFPNGLFAILHISLGQEFFPADTNAAKPTDYSYHNEQIHK